VSKQAICGKLRRALEQHADRRQVVRLVQRRQRNVLLERRDDRRVQQHRRCVFETAVNDAMADADQPMVGEPGPDERDQVIERAAVAEARPSPHDFLGEHVCLPRSSRRTWAP
jgi:hypothetical protein